MVANAEGDGAVVRSATDKVDVPGSKGPLESCSVKPLIGCFFYFF